MSDFQLAIIMMNNVCVPRPVDYEKPFRGQSVFVYGLDDEEDNTFDGYAWDQAVYDGEEFKTPIKDILYWSPAVYYSQVSDIFDRQKSAPYLVMQLTYFAVKYPNPRIMNIPYPEKQSDYYYPRVCREDTGLGVFTPVYGRFEGMPGWWHNNGVKRITHFLPDPRIEPELLNVIFGAPK